MRIIIAGAGEVGSHLAKQLSSKDHDITIIDLNEHPIAKLCSTTDIMSFLGSSTSISILEQSRIDITDLVVAVTSDESVNITTAILAKKLGAKTTIARVSNAEYVSSENLDLIKSLGIDYLIYPEELAAKEIVKLIEHSAATDIVDIEGGKLSIVGIKIDKNVPVINMTMREIAEHYDISSFRVATIHRNSETIIPSGENLLKLNDQVFVITTPSGIDKVLKVVGKSDTSIQYIMILGGGKIGRLTAKLLEDKFQVKLIESNSEKTVELANYLKKTLIIEGDGRDLDLLAQEAIIDMDAFISVTEDAETNIITSLMAKHLGVKKTIAQVDNSDYVPLTQTIGLDSLINKKLIAANLISRFIKKSNIISSLSFSGMNAEVLEYVVKEGTPITQHMVKDLKFPKNSLLGGYIRNKIGYITIGTTQFQLNDKVVVFTLPGSTDKINSFFN